MRMMKEAKTNDRDFPTSVVQQTPTKQAMMMSEIASLAKQKKQKILLPFARPRKRRREIYGNEETDYEQSVLHGWRLTFGPRSLKTAAVTLNFFGGRSIASADDADTEDELALRDDDSNAMATDSRSIHRNPSLLWRPAPPRRHEGRYLKFLSKFLSPLPSAMLTPARLSSPSYPIHSLASGDVGVTTSSLSTRGCLEAVVGRYG
ncbi:hypothetical protein VNI00_010441 [Paramarasmius palmivorus]|uniref:Uncharacterized protein n=1 Tax=Paramarasmius palmivorus TaxID=297713 RepID=A0AAW0CII9_9AGAR